MTITREQEVQAFYKHGLPGMRLAADQRGLMKRCDGADCGRPISNNKRRCNFCQQLVWRELAEQIGDDRSLLDAMLDRNFKEPDARREMLANLRPYLRFQPDKETETK